MAGGEVVNSLELSSLQASGARPLPGRILLEFDAPLTMAGLIHIPESAQTQAPDRTQLVTATVVAIGYGAFYEQENGKLKRRPGIAEGDVKPGDRVAYSPLLQDLNRKFLLTTVTRVEGVLG